MEIKFIKSVWGMDPQAGLDSQLAAIKAAGYDGVECPTPEVDPGEWRDLLAKHQLEAVLMAFPSTTKEAGPAIREAAAYKPLLVNVHSGRDSMAFEEGCRFFEAALAAEEEAGVPVGHETHRSRLFYSPWVTTPYLEKFPSLKVVADFSHWCVVCESLLEDAGGHLDLAISRTLHIHGRVGYMEGPQVPDPSAPEYTAELQAHEEWWDAIVSGRRERGERLTTFDPEFGPPGYMHTLPHTNQPVADLWSVCLWMTNRQRGRWSV